MIILYIKSSPQFIDFLTNLDTSEFRDSFPAPHVTPRIFGALYAASASTALMNHIEKRHRNAGESKRIPPILPAIGPSNQRVSFTQGIGFYHLLKGAGETAEVLVFIDKVTLLMECGGVEGYVGSWKGPAKEM